MRKAYIQLHIAVFLFGFTAILGKLITLPEISLVWWRLLITCTSIVLIPGVVKAVRQLSKAQLLRLSGIGIIVACHWVTFYGSIKFANVSVALSCFATTSFFTSILEPLIRKQPFKVYELLLGLVVIPGMFLIFTFGGLNYITGISMGLVSALLASLFSVLNKQIVDDIDPLPITLVELGAGMLFLTPLVPFYLDWLGSTAFIPVGMDIVYLLLLALLCTTLAYVLSLLALQKLSAFANTLTINLEPIYGIVLSWFFFQEHKEMSLGFYLGSFLIIMAVFAHPFLRTYFEKGKDKGVV